MATPPDFTAGAVLTAAQMNAVGLWKVTPSAVSGTGVAIGAQGDVTLSSATSGTITNCFTSDYNNYRIVLSDFVSNSGSENLAFRLRVGATVAATNYARNGRIVTYTGGVDSQVGNVTTRIPILDVNTTTRAAGTFDIFSPNNSVITSWILHLANFDAWVSTAGINTNATAYPSLELIISGALSGTISIYGYN